MIEQLVHHALASDLAVNAGDGTLDAGSGELVISGNVRDGDGQSGRLTITSSPARAAKGDIRTD